MITLKLCPNCKSSKLSSYRMVIGGELDAEVMPNVKISSAIVTRYFKCLDCNLIFQNPRLSENELNKFYNSGYYRKLINPPSVGMDKGEENRAILDSRIIKQHLEEIKSHLDLGCGMGYLLQNVGSKIKVGTEMDPKYVKFKDIKIYPSIDQIKKTKFDLVTAIHLLEHVFYPLDFLKKIMKLVKKDGYLVIEVPVQNKPGDSLGLPHLSSFEPQVLRKMCIDIGLSVVHEEFTPHFFLICKKVA